MIFSREFISMGPKLPLPLGTEQTYFHPWEGTFLAT